MLSVSNCTEQTLRHSFVLFIIHYCTKVRGVVVEECETHNYIYALFWINDVQYSKCSTY